MFLTSEVIQAYKPFIDEYGMVQPPELVSGNGARYTAEYILVLRRTSEGIPDAEAQRLRVVYNSLEREPGLLMRTPINSFGQQSKDDLISTIYADWVLGTGFSKRWLEYGKNKGATDFDASKEKPEKVWYSRLLYYVLSVGGLRDVRFVFNNIDPRYFTLSAFLYRFLQFKAAAEIVAYNKTSLVNKIYTAFTLYLSAKGVLAGNNDPAMLGTFLCHIMCPKSKLVKWVADKYFVPAIKQKYGETGLAAATWDESRHPTGKYLKGVYE